MKQLRIVPLSLLALVIFLLFFQCLGSTTGNAMAMFARKLGVPCETCQTTIPRLNGTGYKFRGAGFRLPEQIGKPDEKKFELGKALAAIAISLTFLLGSAFGQTEGRDLYIAKCSACRALDGSGNNTIGRGLRLSDMRPAIKSMTDEQLREQNACLQEEVQPGGDSAVGCLCSRIGQEVPAAQ
jgi:hypothetical protein